MTLQDYMEQKVGPAPKTSLTNEETSRVQDKFNTFMKLVKKNKEPLAHIMELDFSKDEKKWLVWWLERCSAYIEYFKIYGDKS